MKFSDQVVNIDELIWLQLKRGGPVAAQMAAIIDAVEGENPHGDWKKFRKIPYNRLAPVRKWLTHRLEREPPIMAVSGLWFGLCYTHHGSKSLDLYLSASSRFSFTDFRWTVEPEYLPDARFARSDALWKIYQTAHRKKGGLKHQAEKPLGLCYAAFVVTRLLSDLPSALFLNGTQNVGVGIGFDSGERMHLGFLDADGFHLLSATGQGTRKTSARDDFWNLIAEVLTETGGDLEAFEESLEERLRRASGEEVLEFSDQFRRAVDDACTPELAGAARLLGLSSADAFLDFRRWLVFQGPRSYRQILQDVDLLGDYAPSSQPLEHWYSEFHPGLVYKEVSGLDLPDWGVKRVAPTTEDEQRFTFPRLEKRLRRK